MQRVRSHGCGVRGLYARNATCVLEHIIWAAWTCGLQIEENAERPLVLVHESVSSLAERLLAADKKKYDWRSQMNVRVAEQHPCGLQHNSDLRCAVRSPCKYAAPDSSAALLSMAWVVRCADGIAKLAAYRLSR